MRDWLNENCRILVVVRSKVPPPWVPSHETNDESRIVVRWKVTVKDCYSAYCVLMDVIRG